MLWYNPLYSLAYDPEYNDGENRGAQLNSERIKILTLKDIPQSVDMFYKRSGFYDSVHAPDYLPIVNDINKTKFGRKGSLHWNGVDTVLFKPDDGKYAKVIDSYDKTFIGMIRLFDELNTGLSVLKELKKIYRVSE